MKITIIGSGALGKAYGGLLSFHHQVDFLVRKEYQALKQAGYYNLEFTDLSKTFKIENLNLYTQASQLPVSDLVIIAIKTNENKNIASLLSACLQENTIVLIIQNGIGNEEWISQFTGMSPVFCGVSTMAAKRHDPCLVQSPSIGELKIAPFRLEDKKYAEKIIAVFHHTPMPLSIKIYDNYKEIRWHKLAWNVPFSALSVIYNQDTFTLASTQPYASIVTNVINEIREIAQSEGVNITPEYVAKMLAFTKSIKNYYPSMYDDYVQGNEIENEYIIDNVLKIAKKNQVSTPMLSLISTHLAKPL